jgi:hypothetical protein
MLGKARRAVRPVRWTMRCAPAAARYGPGGDVGRARGVGALRGAGVDLGVGVAVAVGVGVGEPDSAQYPPPVSK